MSSKSEYLEYFPDLTWDFTPEVIEKRSKDLLSDIKERIDDLTCLPEDKINFQSVCESLSDMDEELQRERNIVEVYFNSSPVGEVQDKCLELNKKWSNFFVEYVMRRDMYDLLTKVQSFEKSLPYESQRYLEKALLYKRRDGLHLEAEGRDKLIALLKKMTNLCLEFTNNISIDDKRIEFAKRHLLGMPDNFFNGLVEKDGKYTVSLKHHHVVPILKQCKIINTRKIMEKAYNSRCIDKNIQILDELIELRNERAKILGYETHADFVTEILMSKSAAKVNEFLTSISEKIQNVLKKEMDRLLELKKKECREFGIVYDGKINPYDCIYYQNMVEEQDYQIDKNQIKEYFPFEHVTKQLLDIYQTVLGLKFENVADAPVIHPEVLLYAVYDKETHTLMGYFYLDLFSRPLKYSQTVCYGIQAGCHYKNKPQVGCAVMIASFTKPFPEKPSLLTHEDVITYFHEFGHVMHHICSKTRYSIFHGTSIERDFVEAPSQMLENWCWEKESLKKISSHYRTREPLSDDLIQKIIKSRRVNIGMFYARQICLSMFDQIIHTTQKVLKECMIKYSGIEPTPGTNFSASFAHLCGGYDAKYYSYLWSQVYSYDMFSKFKNEGIMSSVLGLSYRNLMLLPGSTKDGSEILKEFLGRDQNIDSFMEILGIK